MQRLTDEENARLMMILKQEDLQDWLIVGLMQECFLRVSEALSLRAGDILPDGRVVCHRKKGSKTNVLPIRDPELRQGVQVLLRLRQNKTDLLFNRPRRTLDYRLKVYGAKCGVPEEKCHAHAVGKHTAAQNALEETGGNIMAVKELAGHKSINSTLAYVHMTTDEALALREKAKAAGV
jgi:integrase/recombinase XerD